MSRRKCAKKIILRKKYFDGSERLVEFSIRRHRLDFLYDLTKFCCHRVKGEPYIFLVLFFGKRIPDLKHLCSVYVFAPTPLLCV